MKFILLPILFWTSLSLAATKTFKLDDPAIIGEYKLTPASASAELQTVQIHYDENMELVAELYELSMTPALQAPDKNGVVYDEDEEFDCEDSSCGGVSHILIQLLATKNAKGVNTPQLSIQITSTYPDDAASEKSGDTEYADTTETYTLAWDHALPDGGLPSYTNEHNRALDALVDACVVALNPVVGKYFHSVANICPMASVYGYRGDDTAGFETIKKMYFGSAPNFQPATKADISGVLIKNQRDGLIAAATKDGADATLPLAELAKVEAFVNTLDADQVEIALDRANPYAVILDSKTKRVTFIGFANF